MCPWEGWDPMVVIKSMRYVWVPVPTCCVLSRSVVSDSGTQWIVAGQPPLSMGLSRQKCRSGLPRDLPDPGIKPGSPALQADSLQSEPPENPKNTGVGCHALLQQIFPTQGSNPGLPHCRTGFFTIWATREVHVTTYIHPDTK